MIKTSGHYSAYKEQYQHAAVIFNLCNDAKLVLNKIQETWAIAIIFYIDLAGAALIPARLLDEMIANNELPIKGEDPHNGFSPLSIKTFKNIKEI